jgi:hypothetical protein
MLLFKLNDSNFACTYGLVEFKVCPSLMRDVWSRCHRVWRSRDLFLTSSPELASPFAWCDSVNLDTAMRNVESPSKAYLRLLSDLELKVRRVENDIAE